MTKRKISQPICAAASLPRTALALWLTVAAFLAAAASADAQTRELHVFAQVFGGANAADPVGNVVDQRTAVDGPISAAATKSHTNPPTQEPGSSSGTANSNADYAFLAVKTQAQSEGSQGKFVTARARWRDVLTVNAPGQQNVRVSVRLKFSGALSFTEPNPNSQDQYFSKVEFLMEMPGGQGNGSSIEVQHQEPGGTTTGEFGNYLGQEVQVLDLNIVAGQPFELQAHLTGTTNASFNGRSGEVDVQMDWAGLVVRDGAGNPITNYTVTSQSGFNYRTDAAPPASADLVVNVSDSPDPVANGGEVSYTVAIRNEGPDPATGVTGRFTCQNGEFVRTNLGRSNYFISSNTLQANLPDLAVGRSTTFQIVYKARQPSSQQAQQMTFVAFAFSDREDPANSNNNVIATTGFSTAPPAPTPTPTPGAGLAFWGAGADLAFNEKPDHAGETNAVNQRIPQWSYGYRSAAASVDLTLFTAEQHTNASSARSPNTNPPNASMQGWDPDAVVLVNTGNTDVVYNFGLGPIRPVRPQQLYMKPSVSNQLPVARWTAPAAGRYHVTGRWADLDPNGGNGVSCHVVKNGLELFAQEMENGATVDAPLLVVDMNAGDVLDFVVGPRGDSASDSTAFNAVISRAPRPEITGPENNTILLEGQELVVTAAVNSSYPINRVELRDDGEKVLAHDETAPYELRIPNVAAGTYNLRVVAVDQRLVQGVSGSIKITAVRGLSPVAARGKAATGGAHITAAARQGRTFVLKNAFGVWHEPNDWTALSGDPGVPGPNDTAEVKAGQEVLLSQTATVGTLTLEGKLSAVGETNLIVNDRLAVRGTISGGLVTVTKTAEMLVFANLTSFQNAFIECFGKLLQSGTGTYDAGGTTFVNYGALSLKRPPATKEKLQLTIPTLQLLAGKVQLDPNVLVRTQAFNSKGHLQLGGTPLVSDNGSALVSDNGSALVSDNGSALVGPDGASLVGPDGASLVGMDGASIVAVGGGNSAQAAGGGAEIEARSGGRTVAEAHGGTLLFEEGVVTGTGNLHGHIVNRGAFFAPGQSSGAILIDGDYTQETGGTMLLEVADRTPAGLRSDELIINGVANLGGKLIVNSLSNVDPPASETFQPITWASVSGNFASVSSNADVTLAPDGLNLQISGPNPPAPKALNIATRMRVEAGDNALIAGFIVTGNAPKKVLIRGIGPSLPVSGALTDPTLSLDNGASFNDDWKSTQEAEIRDTTIPPASDLESAIVATLSPGPHTAILRGKDNGTGVGLVEVYDLEGSTPVQLANISTRGLVQAGDNVMIGGFIIGGDYPAKVLLRAIGPSLSVTGKLEDPTLELVDANGGRISNDDWRATQEAEIIATTVPPTNDREAAIVATLVPGFYTAIVRGKDDTAGIGLIEAYNLQ